MELSSIATESKSRPLFKVLSTSKSIAVQSSIVLLLITILQTRLAVSNSSIISRDQLLWNVNQTGEVMKLSEHKKFRTRRDKLYHLPRSIRNYVRWHSKMHDCIRKNSCSSSKPKILLWRCPDGLLYRCGGLGDRMRGIQFSLLLAILTHRIFLVEWPNEPFPFTEAVVPSFLNWTFPRYMNVDEWGVLLHTRWPILNWEDCYPQSLCLRRREKPSHNIPALPKHIDMEKHDLRVVLNKVDNITITTSASFSSVSKLLEHKTLMKMFSDLSPNVMEKVIVHKILLQLLFQPSPAVLKYLHNLAPIKHSTKSYVAVHARTGRDFGEHINPRFSMLPNSTILAKQLLSCVELVIDRNARVVFLASDSVELKKNFISLARGRNIYTITEMIPATHVGRKWGVSRSLQKQQLFSSFLNVFVEFFGLALAKRIIGNRSGF